MAMYFDILSQGSIFCQCFFQSDASKLIKDEVPTEEAGVATIKMLDHDLSLVVENDNR